jgi:2-heptyl-3-hydroxy-4(1H)-quinolone synthase
MKILIVGGGIAGLSLTRALEQHGVAADLVERQDGNTVGGAGLYLPGNGARAVDQLGLLREVIAQAAPVKQQRILDPRGSELNRVDTEAVWSRCGPCLALPRTDMHAILKSGLRRTNITYSRAIAGIRPSGQGCDVTFADGASARYDLVVGADGVNSRVRQAMFPDVTPRFLGQICWRTIIPHATGIDGWTAMLGRGKTLLGLPVNREAIYVYGDVTVPAAEIENYSAETDLKALFAEFGEPLFPLIETIPTGATVHFGRIEQVQMPEWVKGRVVLIGDAAHASSPNMAEGACMAMEDALVLAEAIATADNIDAGLAAYMARRRERVAWVQTQCAARDKLRAMPAFVRSALLKAFGTALYRRGYTPLLKPI